MRIALVQIASPDAETPDRRIVRVRNMIDTIAEDVDLIALPELWTVGYNNFANYATAAESLDGPTVRALRRVARGRRCHVHAGTFIERVSRSRLRNTAALLAPDGRIIHSYSKIHVFGYQSLESELLESGTSADTAATPLGVVGATTCYDLRFPGLWTELGNRGAQLVIVPAAWPLRRLDHWMLLTAARAVDNQLIVVACNATGTQAGTQLAGHSRVVDAWGRVVAEAVAAESITIANVEIGAVEKARRAFPVLADRIDDYSKLAGHSAAAGPITRTATFADSHRLNPP